MWLKANRKKHSSSLTPFFLSGLAIGNKLHTFIHTFTHVNEKGWRLFAPNTCNVNYHTDRLTIPLTYIFILWNFFFTLSCSPFFWCCVSMFAALCGSERRGLRCLLLNFKKFFKHTQPLIYTHTWRRERHVQHLSRAFTKGEGGAGGGGGGEVESPKGFFTAQKRKEKEKTNQETVKEKQKKPATL